MNLLQVENLVVETTGPQGRARVVNDVSLSVAPREAVGLVGESGCGKTMTLKAVIGLLPPSARITGGQMIFDGLDLRDLSPAEWQQKVRGRGISMVFQDPMTALNPVFTVGEQLLDVYRLGGRPPGERRPGRREAVEQALEMLNLVRIPDPRLVMRRYPSELSGGMRQRVLIALALITQPKLILADEPGTALDVSIQDQIMELLRDLIRRQGTSTLFVTHDLALARSLCDRIYVMYAGEIIESASAGELFLQPLHPYTRGLLDSIPRLDGRMGDGIEGMLPDYFNPPVGCRFAPRCSMAWPVCREEPPRLGMVAQDHPVSCHYVEASGGDPT